MRETKTAEIQYAAEKPPADADITEWLNLKACDRWVLLAVDSGIYVFGRQERTLYELDEMRKLRQIPFGPG